MSRPLLVMPCSARKSDAPGLIPARDRYDGSPWRTLRANRAGLELDVLVLSAAHGFIWESLPIASYDRKLDPVRSREILGDISAPWFRDKVEAAPGRVFLMGSGLYRDCMAAAIGAALVERRQSAGRLTWPGPGARGAAGIGEQLRALKSWLHHAREAHNGQ